VFIGHFGIGFAAKKAAPQASLGTLLLAAQFIDLLWPSLLMLGIERVRIVPGITAVTPLDFEHYPYSHSLVAVTIWSALLGLLFLLSHRQPSGRARGALVVAALVLSHWLLDALVHRPDLPLYPGSPLIGLGLWQSLPLSLAVEVPLFAVGTWLYTRTTVADDAVGNWSLWTLIAFLALIHLGNLFGETPPSVEAIAWVAQLQWLLVAWGYWVDRHRSPLQTDSLDTDRLDND
jgi:membrane-bound metal-dependent hydrolase YbcI (DUF457 family)